METKTVSIGDEVIFIDSKRQEHNALVTHVWGAETYPDDGGIRPSLNLVYVLADDKRDDQYGRQLQRETSVVHQQLNAAGCNAWREK